MPAVYIALIAADEYTLNILVPTSIHIPKPLLAAVDRKARSLKISRNRFIVQALQRELDEASNWSPEFFARLESVEPPVEAAAEEMVLQNDRRQS